ncbi:hypothetical protein [Psittacicella hinzii]|uniref:Uncharacterized protein n=1 Tax=Psittacicella hinzii TaxID=2028575 RepID=A0A3A1YGT8_9GAMM|nr:hypothetical protein [Psittacicella hinzii]RIY37453.1 hypothetical protein CKF58_05015 [Psittacicella hinzii]
MKSQSVFKQLVAQLALAWQKQEAYAYELELTQTLEIRQQEQTSPCAKQQLQQLQLKVKDSAKQKHNRNYNLNLNQNKELALSKWCAIWQSYSQSLAVLAELTHQFYPQPELSKNSSLTKEEINSSLELLDCKLLINPDQQSQLLNNYDLKATSNASDCDLTREHNDNFQPYLARKSWKLPKLIEVAIDLVNALEHEQLVDLASDLKQHFTQQLVLDSETEKNLTQETSPRSLLEQEAYFALEGITNLNCEDEVYLSWLALSLELAVKLVAAQRLLTGLNAKAFNLNSLLGLVENWSYEFLAQNHTDITTDEITENLHHLSHLLSLDLVALKAWQEKVRHNFLTPLEVLHQLLKAKQNSTQSSASIETTQEKQSSSTYCLTLGSLPIFLDQQLNLSYRLDLPLNGIDKEALLPSVLPYYLPQLFNGLSIWCETYTKIGVGYEKSVQEFNQQLLKQKNQSDKPNLNTTSLEALIKYWFNGQLLANPAVFITNGIDFKQTAVNKLTGNLVSHPSLDFEQFVVKHELSTKFPLNLAISLQLAQVRRHDKFIHEQLSTLEFNPFKSKEVTTATSLNAAHLLNEPPLDDNLRDNHLCGNQLLDIHHLQKNNLLSYLTLEQRYIYQQATLARACLFLPRNLELALSKDSSLLNTDYLSTVLLNNSQDKISNQSKLSVLHVNNPWLPAYAKYLLLFTFMTNLLSPEQARKTVINQLRKRALELGISYK